MNLKFAGALTSILALAGVAFGQARISPQSIIVNPTPTDLQVHVSVDKGGENPAYQIGEQIRVSVNVNQDAYVYLFSVHSDGNIDLILPNKLSGGNEQLRAGETRTFPPQGANYRLTVDGPAGQDKVLAVASKRQLNLDEIASFQGNQQFATVTVKTQENLARALSIVVEPVPQTDWVTDVAFFQVVGRTPPAPQTGSVSLTGVPTGASVYLDNALVGQAPVTITTTPGRHTIRITAAGYREFTAAINVQAGRTVSFNVNMQQLPREGTLSVRSNVGGALVFVNGQQVGVIGSNGTLNVANLPTGTHEVVVIARGYRAYVVSFTITAGQTTSVQATLNRL
jgi:hypothetical protein